MIWDWKRAKEIRYDNSFDSMYPPIEHLPDTNYWTYCLQLNTYRFMLESEYSMDVGSMFLGVVHPNRDTPQVIELPRLDDEISALVEHEIAQGAASGPIPGENAPITLRSVD